MEAMSDNCKDANESGTLHRGSVIIIARHGERMDYVMRDRGENWVASNLDARPWDTPLTDHGQEQGYKLGREIARQVSRLSLPPVTAVYSSPFLRCRQTALQAIKALSDSAFQSDKEVSTDRSESNPPNALLLRIEMGLAESVNENWYRSWALPRSNGTWGYGRQDHPTIDPSTLHPSSKLPVQQLLDWAEELKTVASSKKDVYDRDYQTKTTVDKEYTFHPKLLESREDQRARMRQVVSRVHETGQTIVLVSHGGPVTHLYESLTGRQWYDGHGDSSYCCYSIYEGDRSGGDSWSPLLVNEFDYLNEKVVTERHVSSDNL